MEKKAKKTQKCNNGDLHCSAVHTKKKKIEKKGELAYCGFERTGFMVIVL